MKERIGQASQDHNSVEEMWSALDRQAKITILSERCGCPQLGLSAAGEWQAAMRSSGDFVNPRDAVGTGSFGDRSEIRNHARFALDIIPKSNRFPKSTRAHTTGGALRWLDGERLSLSLSLSCGDADYARIRA